MRSLAYSAAAQDDLVAMYDAATTRVGPTVAEADLRRLLERCEDLARYPDMGRRRPELDGFGLTVRTLGENGRLIVYAKRGHTLVVARVLRDV